MHKILRRTILAITPNPALDLSGTVKVLKPNEKTYVSNEIRNPWGNSINAGRILNRLGIPIVTSGFLGGSTGDEVQSLLHIENIPTEFIKIQNSTRINVTVSSKHSHDQTRLSFPGPAIKKWEKDRLIQFVKRKKNLSFLLVGGSLPEGFSAVDIIQLIQLTQYRLGHVVAITNRSNQAGSPQ